MKLGLGRGGDAGGSFLPQDYVQRKSEARANFLGLFLFAAVMLMVVGAFAASNRRWESVIAEEARITKESEAEQLKIAQLRELEKQREAMIDKAQVVSALIDPVPRSVLLAELHIRKPDDVTLMELKLESKRQQVAAPAPAKQVKSLSAGAQKNAKPGEGEKPDKPAPPKIEQIVSLVGVSTQNSTIADYIASLKSCPLLQSVELQYIQETVVDEMTLRKFQLEIKLRPEADARQLANVQEFELFSEAERFGTDSAPAAGVPAAASVDASAEDAVASASDEAGGGQ